MLETKIDLLTAEVANLTAAIRELIGSGVSTAGAAANPDANGTETTSRRDRKASADEKAAAEDKAAADENAQTETTGRRSRRGATEAPGETEAKTTSRRSRKAKETKPDPVNDTPEQAELRAQLTDDLRDLADVDEALEGVQDALKRVGAESIKSIASESLEDFAKDIDDLLDQYLPQ